MQGRCFKDFEDAVEIYMFLQCQFQSGINVLKVGLFKCKILEESILRNNKMYILGEKLCLELLTKNLNTIPMDVLLNGLSI